METFAYTGAILIACIYGPTKGLACLVLFFGVKELIEAKKSYDETKRKTAAFLFALGVSLTVCGLLALQ